MPAPSFLIMPARIISLWLVTSASAGASFSVEIRNCEALIELDGEMGTPEPFQRAGAPCIMGSVQRFWGVIMLDRDGFRPNVGIILLNQKNQVFWGKRI